MAEIEDIIITNKKIVTKRGERFSVKRKELYAVFDDVRDLDTEIKGRDRIVKQAAILLAGITYTQAFSNGNKELALLVATDFLNKNGYDLPIEGDQTRKELEDLLVRTVYKFEDDRTIYSEVEEYLREKVELKR